MPTEIEREWMVVEGDKILYGPVDDREDAAEWQSENHGEVIAVPANRGGMLV